MRLQASPANAWFLFAGPDKNKNSLSFQPGKITLLPGWGAFPREKSPDFSRTLSRENF
jgi:hypothetical protein